MSSTDQRIEHLPVDQIEPNPLQPRASFNPEELNELVDSIIRFGILEPLVVAHTPAGYQIIAGERRWRAAKLAKLRTVPVVIRETSPNGMLEMAIVENVQRVDLNPMDRAKAFERLSMEFGLSNADIAQRVGKSPSFVANTLRLLKMPDALKDGLLGGTISEGHARALTAIEDPKLMIEAYKEVLRTNGSVRMAEDLARRAKDKVKSPQLPAPGSNADRAFIVSNEIDRWTKKLKEYFGQNSNVRLTRSNRETKVVIALKGSPEHTQEQLDAILRLAEQQ